MFAALGLPTVMVGALVVRGDKVGGRFYFGNGSDRWTGVYLEKLFADEPLVHETRRRMSPFSWRKLWAEGDLPQAVRDVIETGRQRPGRKAWRRQSMGPVATSEWSHFPEAR